MVSGSHNSTARAILYAFLANFGIAIAKSWAAWLTPIATRTGTCSIMRMGTRSTGPPVPVSAEPNPTAIPMRMSTGPGYSQDLWSQRPPRWSSVWSPDAPMRPPRMTVRVGTGRDQLELVRVIRPALQMLSEHSVVAEQGWNATGVQE